MKPKIVNLLSLAVVAVLFSQNTLAQVKPKPHEAKPEAHATPRIDEQELQNMSSKALATRLGIDANRLKEDKIDLGNGDRVSTRDLGIAIEVLGNAHPNRTTLLESLNFISRLDNNYQPALAKLIFISVTGNKSISKVESIKATQILKNLVDKMAQSNEPNETFVAALGKISVEDLKRCAFSL